MKTEAGVVADPLPPAQRTLPEMLRRQADLFGDRPLLRLAGGQWSHRSATHAAATRAGALARSGVRRGDRVAVMTSNRIEFLEVFLGCGWLGAVVVPVNTASMGPQIGYFVFDSQAELLVIEAQFLERLQTADLGRTKLREIWVVGAVDGAGDGDVGAVPLRAVPYPAGADAVAAAGVQPGDPLAILYTSGTTGPAKGVVCPHAQYYAWGVNSADVLGVRADDVLCTTLPLFHINALNTLAQASITGCEVVFETRFSASGFWPAMQACGATVVYLLGAMVPILLAQPEGPAERAHRVRIGLGPGVPAAAGAAFRARTGVLLLEGYGSTETNFVIATAPDSPRTGVMGWLRPGFEARVADEDDVPVGPGEAGELLLRADAPHAFAAGYFNMPAKTVEAWRNLWFHTGDRVVRDDDGAFRFVDRIKDAIRRRGENISSFEVEQVLLSHPGVAECAVYPVRSELAEDEVMAALVARADQAVDPAELARFCESRLPYFAIPRYIDVLADLPRTENGKVQKFRLRERGVTTATWDRGAAPGNSMKKHRSGERG
ncbi:ATP-dependent acyl-CoA ligase [Variovorax sp. J22G21]|uniref:ATP-dependent acyl-CoA ligase n=1 Tax=Variovorax fucosicus TaxID=3053517 RepID=UPI0025761AD5|nr:MULTISPECIES: ATP-dependent acyl-CoA ligase [unclassified Variovorax]MDM0041784.1 ATP-dependent acyl-CoA ligase [Variovorax sp. J22R193]MDM0059623.1 ATP-dependent acyl-CoA ligase [Variovorax sp. J22G21]